MQTNQPELFLLIKEAVSRGVIIINISQCRIGRVEPFDATGNQLLKLGVIEGSDMLYETALAKLSYVLGKVLLYLTYIYHFNFIFFIVPGIPQCGEGERRNEERFERGIDSKLN